MLPKETVKGLTLNTAYEFGCPKKYVINNDNDIKNLQTKEIDYFVNCQTLDFFKRFNIDTSFLEFELSK